MRHLFFPNFKIWLVVNPQGIEVSNIFLGVDFILYKFIYIQIESLVISIHSSLLEDSPFYNVFSH